jgi:rhamnose utilization protein RhaD (predicted bifunctional aldolase and dehydrogenase)/NAD(P)-dependent dehydrogenase (short-subunit alcohol dehydrogenase family)
MKSLWSDREAEALVARYAEAGIGRDLALRVYSSRLLGGDRRLVLHGGGNTSLKTTIPDLFGQRAEVLCIKGSGADLATIEPAGLPAVRLGPLRRLRDCAELPDDELVRLLRASLIDPGAPSPSVETLLHAFLPHKYIDHTHATPVLSLADQPKAENLLRAVYGRRAGIVPYVMSGLPLARAAAEMFEGDSAVDGLILVKHGIFSFGDTAREAYERMIALASLAEDRLGRNRKTVFQSRPLPDRIATPAEIAPILRGLCAIPDRDRAGTYTRFLLDFRTGSAIRNFVDGDEIERYGRAGVATPDHAIRTKPWPLIAPALEAGKLDDFAAAARAEIERFAADYRAYFARNNAASAVHKRELDPMPRVILVPGLGLFGLGPTARDAGIAADIAESWVGTVTDAEAVGTFQSLNEADAFHIEYWSLEQAKLGKGPPKPLAGQVAVVTGGAGTIGVATARLMNEAGAEIALVDQDAGYAAAKAAELGGIGIGCDVIDPAAVRTAFDSVVGHFGGVDIVVSNAGAAWQGRIGEVEDGLLRKSFELNFFAHQSVAQNAVRIMRAQGIGGCLLFNVSRQAVSQGPDVGPYGLPKAATLFLTKQYALEYAADGIRANAVNADGIRSGLLTPEFIGQRATAYGMTEAEYMSRNLLKREVTAEDVAQAFLSLALARNTTGAFLPVDGGNLAAAPR